MRSEHLSFEDLSSMFAALAEIDGSRTGIGVTDTETGRYARVVEYGSVAGQRPWPQSGPRTTLAINPETGEEVVVSAQAPLGFIRVNTPAIMQTLTEELQHMTSWLDADALGQELDGTVREAARNAVDLLRTSAPRDTGKLADSLQVTDAD